MADHALKTAFDDAPQSAPIPGRESEMTRNAAGGFVFTVDAWQRLERFLILGSEGGTYYVRERPLTLDNAGHARTLLERDGRRVVDAVKAVSDGGRGPRNDQALFVLAMAAAFGDTDTRRYALSHLQAVARTGAHLLQWFAYVRTMRGVGRSVKQAVAAWYARDANDVAFQCAKYRERHGYTHRDVRTLVRAKPDRTDRACYEALRWISEGDDYRACTHTPQVVRGVLALRSARTERDVVAVLDAHPGISHEMVPGELKGPKVWKALLPRLPQHALLRNLATLTRHGLLPPMGEETRAVARRLKDPDRLARARMHPLAMLVACETYRQGHGMKGRREWTPTPEIEAALEEGFYAAFGRIEPIDKRVYVAVDISGSMTWGSIAGSPVHPFEAAAAMGMVFARAARACVVRAFSTTMAPLRVGAHSTMKEVLGEMRDHAFGGTDCALPMIDAQDERLPVDVFVVLTDNETWAGCVHPRDALAAYRKKMQIPAKLVVVGMTATDFTIADPNDAGMLDVVGMDTATPQLVEDFARDG